MGNKQRGSHNSVRKPVFGGNSEPQVPKMLKAIAWGDWGVGKSSITLRYCQNMFIEDEDVGRVVDMSSSYQEGKIIRLQDGREVEVRLWEGGGAERYKTIAGSSWNFPIVLDITNRESFEHIDEWMRTCERYSQEYTARIMCGLKSDRESERQVSRSEGESKAHQLGADHFCELSSKMNSGIEEMLQQAVRIALDKQAA